MNRIIYVMLAIAITACSKMESAMTNEYTGETVPVRLSFTIENENSKAVNDPQEITSVADVVKNLWIIQFNGTSDNSRVIGEPAYIENFSTWDGCIELVATDQPCTIYYIANTFEKKGEFPIGQWATIADIKNLRRHIKEQDDLFVYETEEKQHILMSGHSIVDKIDASASNIAARLKRNIAKLDITITNASEGAVIIRSIQLCSVVSASYYTSDLSETKDQFPASSDYNKLNYNMIPWSSQSGTMKYTAYVSVNKRGRTQSTEQKTKNDYAPDGSTYLLINAVYGTENYPLTYTFYLGEDLINDHNLNANKIYSYNFIIKSIGDADNDSRVTNWGLVDFTDEEKYPLSNCYILNPMPNGTEHRHFRIPIKRIMEFWGNGTDNKYENQSNYSLRDNNAKWKCFILASDFIITDENFRIVKGTGFSKTDPYFEVSVSPGTKGNVIVGIGNDIYTDNTVSWSWHLWITDYDPYPALKYGEGKENQYIYSVPNGSVHRYKGWSASLKKEYIMDRNIGALTPDTYPEEGQGLLYYQYGRKDPFFISGDKYIYYTNNKRFNVIDLYSDNNNITTAKAVSYSVSNPLTFIKGEKNSNSWVQESIYINKNYIWNDPQTVTGGTNPGGKSIFDPCPPGYRLPDKTLWSDWTEQGEKDQSGNIIYKDLKVITTNVFKGNTGNVKESDDLLRKFQSYLKIKGEQYWPNQNGEDIPQKVIYYPAAGYLTPSDGTVSNNADSKKEPWSFVWTEACPSNNTNNGIAHATQPDHLTTTTPHPKGRAFPVRCITDVKRHNN